MGLSCFRAISGWDGYGYGIGLDLCVGLFYEHRFAMLIIAVMVVFVLTMIIISVLNSAKLEFCKGL